MKKIVFLITTLLTGYFVVFSTAYAESGGYKPSCDIKKTTVCTIEMWLAHKHKKNNREIRKFLKSKTKLSF